jgi:hypothetical protein
MFARPDRKNRVSSREEKIAQYLINPKILSNYIIRPGTDLLRAKVNKVTSASYSEPLRLMEDVELNIL